MDSQTKLANDRLNDLLEWVASKNPVKHRLFTEAISVLRETAAGGGDRLVVLEAELAETRKAMGESQINEQASIANAEKLVHEVNELQKKLDATQSLLDKANDQITDLRAGADKSGNTAKITNSKVAKLNKQIEEMQKKLDRSEERCKELQRQIGEDSGTTASDREKKLDKANGDLKQKVADLAATLRERDEQIEALQQEVEQLTEHLSPVPDDDTPSE